MRTIICILWVFSISAMSFAQDHFAGKYAMILLNHANSADFAEIQHTVDMTDGHIIHCFEPTIMQGYVTAEGEIALRQSGLILAVTDGPYEIGDRSFSDRDRMVINAWNQQFVTQLATRGEDEDGGTDRNVERPGKYQTSEYMMGSVAVGLVFVESDGTLEPKSESWDEIGKEDMFFQIRKGLEWWAQQGGYRSSLSWTYEFFDVKTKYEPITHSYRDADTWTTDAARKLGYGTGDAFSICNEFANSLRTKYKTDWAFVIFAVPADNDADGNWKGNGAVAWANLGGPLLVINNRCDGWGPEDVWQVTAHETGHIFYALDEYEGGSRGSERTGLLNVINGNAKDGGLIDEDCIMKAHGIRLCDYTRAHVGWIDDNDDGVYIVDYLGLSKKFNQKMLAREAKSELNKRKRKIEYVDPRVEKNKKYYDENFQGNSRGWSENTEVYIKDGSYSITGTVPMPIWLPDTYGDVTVSTDVEWQSGAEDDYYGIDVYSMETEMFHNLYINKKGQYLTNEVKAGEGYYLTWKTSPAVKPTGNSLSIKCLGRKISMFINDQLVQSYEESNAGDRSFGMASGAEVRAAFKRLTTSKP